MKENEPRLRAAARRLSGAIAAALCASLLILGATTAGAQDSGAAAENGKINGKVVSSETGEPLAFANIVLFQGKRGAAPGKPAGGASTQADGSYRLAAAPGTYWMTVSYISFNPTHVEEVVVAAGAVTELSISLVPEAVELAEIQVTASAIRTSESALLANQKKSSAVSDAVSSEQIKKTPDSDAAEVMQRVTGVSVVDDKFVFVRGLGERYSTAQVNGTTVGSPEPNKRILPLDMFAAGLLDNIVVQKTYTVDKPADFGGGVVDINTRDFPGQRIWSIGLGSGYNSRTTGKSFSTYESENRKLLGLDLGFDGGSRGVPELIQQMAEDKLVRTAGVGGEGFTAEEVQAMGRAFGNVWTPRGEDGSAPRSLNASFGDELRLAGRPLGVIFSGSYSNSFQVKSGEKNAYQDATLAPLATYQSTESSDEVLWGVTANSSYRVSKRNTLKLWSMYNRSAEDLVRFYEGYNEGTQSNIRGTRLQYVERGLLSGTAGMSHNIPALANATLAWEGSYSTAQRNEPDRREYIYKYVDAIEGETTEGHWEASLGSGSSGLVRQFEQLNDWERGFKSDLSIPFTQWNGLESKIKIGGAWSGKDRESRRRLFRFRARSSRDLDLTAPPESLLVAENIEPRTFSLVEDTRSTDNFSGEQRVSASYALVDIPLSRRIRVNTGVRLEHLNQDVVTYPLFAPDAPPIIASPRSTDALPAANLTYTLGAKTNLRFGYSKTLNRPELSELSPQEYYDYICEEVFRGNPNVTAAKLHNYDGRVEHYPSGDELLAVSTFYKALVDPITRSYLPGAEDQIIVPINADAGWMYGVEIETRLGLRRASSRLAGWKIGGNLTLVESQIKVPAGSIVTSLEHALEGQSPYVANLGLYFEPSGRRLAGSMLYSAFGERLDVVGANELPDKFETARGSLDATLAYPAARGMRFKLSGRNLLDDDVRFEQGGKTTRSYARGRSVALSLSIGS